MLVVLSEMNEREMRGEWVVWKKGLAAPGALTRPAPGAGIYMLHCEKNESDIEILAQVNQR